MKEVYDMCPFFNELDSFLGCKPLSKPHFMIQSAESSQPKPTSGDDSSQDPDLTQDPTADSPKDFMQDEEFREQQQ